MFATSGATLTPFLDGVRISLHILAATVWVGGQIALAGAVPKLRAFGSEATKAVANQFAKLAWPAFGLLVITGFWNYFEVARVKPSSQWIAVFSIKMFFVVASGAGAFFHARSTSKAGLAIWGSVAGMGAIIALVLGVFIAG
ncbi:MAG: hypothetical protein HKL80_10185 [Acidimicrobiales bacterium]|nr:hypothetical protein [Acidimicrobiales bacterium]